MAEETRNLCAQIPASLHAQVREQQEASGQTLGQYMTWLITSFYANEQGGKTQMNEKRTVVPAELFEQFKEYLKQNHLTQSAFFLDCIQRALAEEPSQTTEQPSAQ